MEEKSKRELKKIRDKVLRDKEVQDGVYDGRLTSKVHKPRKEKNIDYYDEIDKYYFDDDDYREENEEEIEVSPWRRDISEET